MIYWNQQDDAQDAQGDGKVSEAPHRILIVEDDVNFAESLLRLLSGPEREVRMVHSGGAALERVAAESFDLILMDINLPDMTGHQVLQSFKERGLNTPAIVVSGETEIDAAILALRRGALDFVRKPVEPEMLLHTVRRALHQSGLEHSHKQFQQRMANSERLHRFLVDRSPDIIFILDQDGRVTYINDRIEVLLGIPHDKAVDRHFSRLAHEHDRERARYAFSGRKLAETAKHNFELRLRCTRDNGFRHFEINLAAVGMPEGDAPEPGGDQGHYYGVARDITLRREVEDLAVFQSNHDALTGLPNRTLFRDHLGLALIQAKRNREYLAVLFLNLDRFKNVNDLYGHVKADELLRQVGERIQRCLRGGDTLARFGGDEFLLLNTGIQSQEEVLAIVERINIELAEPFKVSGNKINMSVSAGISLFPDHGETADALILHANIALYHGRLSGTRSHTFFMHEMGASTSHRLELETALRQALDQDEFELHFQPQVDLKNRRIKGLEALIRWNHPTLGLLPPGEFLPVAEDSGLIIEIGEWVTKRVCKTLRQWDAQGIAPPRVAINISPLHLDQVDFVDNFIAWLTEYDIAPMRIEVELTENLFIRDPGAVAEKLQALAAHGVMIAIDDFGTQYSSLSYLQKFPIHTLKIDKSFVWEIDREYRQHAIIKAIISIAHGLNLNLVAEGVETDAQLNFLESQGCDEIQGYLISKPLGLSAIEPLLRQSCARPSHQQEPPADLQAMA